MNNRENAPPDDGGAPLSLGCTQLVIGLHMMKHLAHAALVEVLPAHWTILEMIRRGWTGWAWSSPVQPAASLVVAIVIWTGAPIGAPTGLLTRR
ncbi:hypothetical protein [Mesorhizobium sp.]|uniref:hypothetical protein n=1 Tax=Mesorhizobium sp. TaxID=1871066 RepID=UPI000FEAB3AC|nr:hypothetical protein [Mesorhizobium sp.]RWO38581.1 MAG: hypothetical protein EOS13_34380 [Mesorhizobium sp.]TIN21984.1 MAG: hypothetical protein E5Y19_33950 [Mesorhizobium sp.]TIN32205.1 MAG: hypothetical protein E5Y13_35160 [Mesorhizobium sp.]